ncbi:hypothetical protein HMPREF0321_0152 [Dermacoccus sp. Ellin185]|nr:hypothetical protein HMPREF0321_0152 [Dermacoccus sp. Ellin185]
MSVDRRTTSGNSTARGGSVTRGGSTASGRGGPSRCVARPGTAPPAICDHICNLVPFGDSCSLSRFLATLAIPVLIGDFCPRSHVRHRVAPCRSRSQSVPLLRRVSRPLMLAP